MTSNPNGPSITPNTGHDTLPVPGPARIEGMPEELQLGELDKLAGTYDKMTTHPDYTTSTGPDFAKIEDRIAEAKKALLLHGGFVADGPGRTDEQKDAYNFADSVFDRAMRSSEEDWRGHMVAGGRHDGVSVQVFQELLDRYQQPSYYGSNPTNPERAAEIKAFKELRDQKREAFAAFMGGPRFGSQHKENKQRYDQAEKAYLDAMDERNGQELDDKKAELMAAGFDEDSDEMTAELKWFAKQQAEQTNEEDQEEQRQLLIKNNGWLGKMLDRYANLPRKDKIKWGVVLGAASLALGGGIGFLFGGAGTLVGAGLLMGLRGSNAFRTYNIRKAELFKVPPEYAKLEFEDGVTVDELVAKQREFLENASREHLEDGEKIKKRAALWTLGSVALVGLGGVAGVVAHMDMLDAGVPKHLVGGQLQHWLEQSQSHSHGDIPVASHAGIDTPGSGASPGDLPGHSEQVPDNPPYIPSEGAPVPTDPSETTSYIPSGGAPIPESAPTPLTPAIDIWKGAPTERVLQKLYAGLTERDAYLDINKLYDKLGPDGVFTDASGHVIHLSEHSPNNIWLMQSSGKIQLSPAAQAYLDQLHGHAPSANHLDTTAVKFSDAHVEAQPGGFNGTHLDAPPAVKFSADMTPGATPGSNTAETVARLVSTENLSGSDSTQALERVIGQGNLSPANLVSRAERWHETFDALRKAGVVDIPSGQYDSFLRQVGPELAKLKYDNGTPLAFFDRLRREWRMYSPPANRQLPPAALKVITSFASRNNYTLAA